MGSFQASMLEAFQSLRDKLTYKKQVEVDQTSASKPGTSQAVVNLDLPPPRQPRTTSNVEQMEVDYNPALPPHLRADHHLAWDQPSSPTEEPSKKASVRPKTHSRHEVEPRSASDQFNDESDEPQIASSKSKKHADKSKHKVRSRYVASSSEEDQSSVARHRSSKPKLGKISPRSTLLLPLPRLHLLAMLLLKSVNIALSQPLRGLRLRSRKVPILRKQQSVDMNKPVST